MKMVGTRKTDAPLKMKGTAAMKAGTPVKGKAVTGKKVTGKPVVGKKVATGKSNLIDRKNKR